MVVALAAVFLSACGGGGDDPAAASASMSNESLAKTTTGFTPKPVTPTVLTPVAPGNSPAVVIGATVTDVRVQNTGAAQANVPFTFGQIIAAGQMSASEGLAAKLPDGTVVRLQTDIKATHPDGSVRHVIVSGILPSLAAGQIQTLQLAKTGASAKSTQTLQSLASSGLTSKVTLTIDNVQYSASLGDALAASSASPVNWLSGDVVNEWIVASPLRSTTGAVHPLLEARFAVRWYSGLSKQARVDVIVENNKTFTAGARNLTYDVNIDVGGRSVYAKAGLTHYHHSRWHQSAWWDGAREPAIHVQHNTDYLIASKAVSNYDRSVVPAESELAALGKKVTAETTGPMTIGPALPYMAATGGRGDIGPLPNWSVMYLLSMDKRARDAMMAAADGSASWSTHYRDEKTGYPVRADNEANKRLSTHPNMAATGPLPTPRCATPDGSACNTPYAPDTAHQPSLVYLPYLLTGDYYYLEELHFWAAWNPLGTDSNNHGQGQGLVRWQQLRGQAWSLRTLGHAAYITPDGHTLKDYFTKQLDNNLNYYHDILVTANPNQLGVYDGSGANAYRITSSSPWQDDFFTWSFGYLAELGFSKATPILHWKAKYPVGRMTAPGVCWTGAATYSGKFRDSEKSPVYGSFAEMYSANFGGNTISSDDGRAISHPQGLKFIEQGCGSQAQANWMTTAAGYTWTVGRMMGYADSTMGYPSNMQPALAVAVSAGVESASHAWSLYDKRASKPDYSKGPQWAIVPR